ncbi:helix-turn-helix transcriptional regulator [Paenibacillus rigui]|uniref:AraC family transcriptional regulator n=1 Tax=Paenibacillus rigui TaxID=554312 RepID=A0A229URD0_9BACL|nr:helix-turn-helix transcriptional regulator [Paenibacillus rigui]OXM85745.1 AraC family transcriptional regulator [Paenibacillus rigui]
MNDGLISMKLPPMPYFITIGESTFRPGEQHPSRRKLGIFDLLFVVKGALYMGEDDRHWTVAEGQTLLLLPDRYHYPVKPCETETVFYWIHFDFPGVWYEEARHIHDGESDIHPVRQTWSNPYQLRIPQYASLPEFALAERHLRKMLADFKRHRSAAYWNGQQLFLELLRLLEEQLAGKEGSPAKELADQTEAYLRQHYQAEVTNGTLAEALRFHPNYIVRCMKEIYACTPMEYLHRYRMEQAKLLLVKTEWPMTQIAEHVGFPNTPYFSNCFKQYAGISPMRFRKQYLP